MAVLLIEWVGVENSSFIVGDGREQGKGAGFAGFGDSFLNYGFVRAFVLS
jgi:hypothetical protein